MPLPRYDPRDPFNLIGGGTPPPAAGPTLPPPVGVTPEQSSDTGTGTTGTPGNTGGSGGGGGGGGGGRNTQQPYTEPGYGGTYTPPGVIYTPPTPEETRRSSGETQISDSTRIDRLIERGYTPEAAIHGYYPPQPEDTTQMPRDVQDLAARGWIITSETKQATLPPTIEQLMNRHQLFQPEYNRSTQTTYYASRPSIQQTFEYVYGKDRADVLTGAAFSKSFFGLETVGSAIQEYITGDRTVGESEKESLMEYSLQTREYGKRYGAAGGLVHSIYGSPAVQETAMWAAMEVGAPVVFAGLGRGASLIGRGSTKITDLIGSGAGKVTRFTESLSPTGKTVFNKLIGTSKTIIETGSRLKEPLIKTGMAFGKAAGTRLGQTTIIGDLYLLTEGPMLVKTAKTSPQRFGGRLTESLGLWGAMSTSILKGTKEFKLDTTPKGTTSGFTREAKKEQTNIIQDFINRNKKQKAPGFDYEKTIIDNQRLLKKTKVTDWTKTDVVKRRQMTDVDYGVTTKGDKGSLYNVQRDVKPEISTGDLKGSINKNIKKKRTVVEQYYEDQSNRKLLQSKKYADIKKSIASSDDRVIFQKGAKQKYNVDYTGYTRKPKIKQPEPKPLEPNQYKDALNKLSDIDETKFIRQRPINKKTRAKDITEAWNTQRQTIRGQGKDVDQTLRRLSTNAPDERMLKATEKTPRDWFTKKEVKSFLKDTRGELSLDQTTRIKKGFDNRRNISNRSFFGRDTVYSRKPSSGRRYSLPGGTSTKTIGYLGTLLIGAYDQEETGATDYFTGEISRTKRQTGFYTDLFPEQKPRTDEDIDILPKTDERREQKSGYLTDTMTQQKQDTRQDLITRTQTDQDRDYRTTYRPRPPRPGPPRPGPPRTTPIRIPPIITPPREEKTIETTKQKTASEPTGYIPQVHHKGRWINLTSKTLPPREARDILAETLDQSRAAVGRLKPSKGRLTTLGIKTKDYNTLRHKFKEKNDLIIEKREYRIDSPGEKKQITALGHMANRLRGTRTRAGLNNTNYMGKQQNIRFQNQSKRTNKRQRYV